MMCLALCKTYEVLPGRAVYARQQLVRDRTGTEVVCSLDGAMLSPHMNEERLPPLFPQVFRS